MRTGFGSAAGFRLCLVPLSDPVFDQPLAQRADFFFPLTDVHHPALFGFAQLKLFFLYFAAEHFQFLDRGAETLDVLIPLLERFGKACEVFLGLCPQAREL